MLPIHEYLKTEVHMKMRPISDMIPWQSNLYHVMTHSDITAMKLHADCAPGIDTECWESDELLKIGE